ncbi:MAG: NAD(P)/FAD-dependent oxidoreductase [Candidatus Geothermarchaeales archaeon]
MYDALVVGTGPAGATAAFLLAKSGLKTAIIDKRTLPRKKVCGGLITAHCTAQIKSLFGMEIPTEVHVEPPVLTERVVPPSGRENGFHNPSNHIRNVDRGRFDYWLTRMALREGASLFSPVELADIRENKSGLVVRFRAQGDIVSMGADYLIGADGVYSTCRKELFGGPPQRTISVMQEYYEDRGAFGNSFYLFFKGEISPIYAYVVPKDGHTLLGLGVHRSLGPTAHVGLSRFRKWLYEEYGYEAAKFVCREGWSIPFGDVAYGKGRVLLVGDAGGFCEPFTGEGIYFGIESAKAAAMAILSKQEGPGSIADGYRAIADPIGRKMQDITDYVLTLTDEERERRIQAKQAMLARESKVSVVT